MVHALGKMERYDDTLHPQTCGAVRAGAMELTDDTPQSNVEIPRLSRIMRWTWPLSGAGARVVPFDYTEWPVENGFRSTTRWTWSSALKHWRKLSRGSVVPRSSTPTKAVNSPS